MRKITFYLMLLFCTSVFAQIEVVDDFNSIGSGKTPEGWTGDFTGVYGQCTERSVMALNTGDAGTAMSLTSGSFNSNGTELALSFTVNVLKRSGRFYDAPPAGWGNLVLEYTVDGGTTWTNLVTVDDTNYTYTDYTSCVAFNATVPAATLTDGTSFQARFVFTKSLDASTYIACAVDEVSFTQTATTVPNCTTVTAPENAATVVETNPSTTISWNKAVGYATGYKLSIGTTEGGTDVLNAYETTETSYDVSALAYDTTYYVSVVPFNSFGDATSCTSSSFTTRSAPIQGSTCSDPIVIDQFPVYTHNASLGTFENLYSSNKCTSFSGRDAVYKIEPTEDIAIDINLIKTDVDVKGAVLAVLNGCPDSATECLGFAADYTTDNRELTDISLMGGNTYYIVVSSKSLNYEFGYTLVVTKKDCINPTLTTTPVADCDNGQFTVDVDVTYLGGATSLTLTDDQGNSKDAIAATGVVNMGPYPSGTTVNFTLKNDNADCSAESSTYFYCPPSNDDCATPIALQVNTDDTCTLFTSATNAGATHSEVTGTACNTTGTNDVWFSFEAVNESVVIEYLNITEAIGSGGTYQSTEILSGTCADGFTSMLCENSASYIVVSGLTVGETYFIRNYTRLGTDYAQNYDICLKNTPAPPANDDCSGAVAFTASTDNTCNNKVSGTTTGATFSEESQCANTTYLKYADVWYTFTPETSGLFEFNLTKSETSATTPMYFVYSGTCGALEAVSTACNQSDNAYLTLDSETTYYVAVRSLTTNGKGADFDLCVSPVADAAANNSCSSAIAFEESLDIEGNHAVTGSLAQAYPSVENCNPSRFTIWYSFTPQYTGEYFFNFTTESGTQPYFSIFSGDCSDLQQNLENYSSCWGTGEKSTNLEAGKTYYISIHDTAKEMTYKFFMYPNATLGVNEVENTADFKYFPNPIENNFTIEAKSEISTVAIYNLVGQQVALVKPNTLSTTLSMGHLQNGVYFVKVDINGTTKTLKVIKK